MEYCLEQVMQKDLGKRLQVGQELVDHILDQEKLPDLEQDQSVLDRMVDGVACSWVNASNFKVRDGMRGRRLRELHWGGISRQVALLVFVHWSFLLLLVGIIRDSVAL